MYLVQRCFRTNVCWKSKAYCTYWLVHTPKFGLILNWILSIVVCLFRKQKNIELYIGSLHVRMFFCGLVEYLQVRDQVSNLDKPYRDCKLRSHSKECRFQSWIYLWRNIWQNLKLQTISCLKKYIFSDKSTLKKQNSNFIMLMWHNANFFAKNFFFE